MKVLYRQTASDDIVRQLRYYLLTAEPPEIALRFREAVRHTIQSLGQNPHVGPRYSSSKPRLHEDGGQSGFKPTTHGLKRTTV